MKKDFRFHPLFILVESVSMIKNLFFAILFAFVLQLNNDNIFWTLARYGIIAGIIIGIITIILTWATTTYRFEEDRLILKRGIFSKTRTTIDYARIQNVQRITSIVHKPFGITSLQFLTASSTSSAIDLKAISTSTANELETLVQRLKQQETVVVDEINEDKEESETLQTTDEFESTITTHEEPKRIIHFQATRKQTIKAAFTSLSFLIIFPVLGFLINRGSELFKMEELLDEWFTFIIASYILIAIAIVALLFLGILIGLISTYLKYGKFIISSDEDQIYIERGILSEQSFTIRKKNVQGLQITQNLLKRLLKLREIKLVHIGQGGNEENSIDSLYPFLEEKDATKLIQQVLPSFSAQPTLKKLPKSALYLHLFAIPYLFIIILIGTIIWHWNYWWVIGVGVYTVVSRLLNYFFTRYALENESIFYKTGAWTTEMFLTNRNNIIEIAFRENFFQRWFQVCTIEITTRAQPVHVVSLKHVPVSFAEDTLDWYEQREFEIE